MAANPAAMGGWLTALFAAGSSTKLAGGSNEEALKNVAFASGLAWIPTGSGLGSVFGEAGKSAVASGLSQKATSGEVDYRVVATYGILGAYGKGVSELGSLIPGFGLKPLGNVITPIGGSIIIEDTLAGE